MDFDKLRLDSPMIQANQEDDPLKARTLYRRLVVLEPPSIPVPALKLGIADLETRVHCLCLTSTPACDIKRPKNLQIDKCLSYWPDSIKFVSQLQPQ